MNWDYLNLKTCMYLMQSMQISIKISLNFWHGPRNFLDEGELIPALKGFERRKITVRGHYWVDFFKHNFYRSSTHWKVCDNFRSLTKYGLDCFVIEASVIKIIDLNRICFISNRSKTRQVSNYSNVLSIEYFSKKIT